MRALSRLFHRIVIHAVKDERSSTTFQRQEVVVSGKAERIRHFIRAASNEESFREVLGSRREGREIGAPRMVARRLGRLEKPRWL
jgi:hypothetical protein